MNTDKNKDVKTSKLKNSWKTFMKNKELLLISLPAMISLFLFAYLPMFGVFIAFKNINYTKGILGSDWVGLKNFEFFFTSQDAFRVTRNTIGYNIVFIAVGTIVALLVAMLLYDVSAGMVKLFQTVLFLPYFISWVVAGYISYIYLNPSAGIVNQVMELLELGTRNWYSEPDIWPFILLLAYLWKNVGYIAIIFYTSMLSIDKSIYEAASIDGVTKFQRKIHITIPMIKPIIIIMTMLSIGKIMYADFGLFYFIPKNSGLLYAVSDVIDTYVYRSLRVTGELGMSAAAAFYQSIVGCLLVVVTNKILKKISPENAIF